jgi:hypothetical protein
VSAVFSSFPLCWLYPLRSTACYALPFLPHSSSPFLFLHIEFTRQGARTWRALQAFLGRQFKNSRIHSPRLLSSYDLVRQATDTAMCALIQYQCFSNLVGDSAKHVKQMHSYVEDSREAALKSWSGCTSDFGWPILAQGLDVPSSLSPSYLPVRSIPSCLSNFIPAQHIFFFNLYHFFLISHTLVAHFHIYHNVLAIFRRLPRGRPRRALPPAR